MTFQRHRAGSPAASNAHCFRTRVAPSTKPVKEVTTWSRGTSSVLSKFKASPSFSGDVPNQTSTTYDRRSRIRESSITKTSQLSASKKPPVARSTRRVP